MLTLSRKIGESIMISDNIEVVLLSTQGEQARIGVSAPKDIPIHRREIFEQIQSENRESTRYINVGAVKQWIK
jgi:carbon storage regulator